MTSTTWAEQRQQERQIAARQDRDSTAFATSFGVRKATASAYNLSRMIRSTGERPGRVAEMKKIIHALASQSDRQCFFLGWGVFDHGDMWCRFGKPVILVGHPYDIADHEREFLTELGRYNTLRVSIDDRPSYYGFGTHHVRIEVANPTTPYRVPKSTANTRRIRAEFTKELSRTETSL
jgi:hypothetical protein